MSTYGKYTCL